MYRLQCTLPVWPSGRGREELEPRALQLVGICQLVNIGVTVYDALHEACAPGTYACTPIWQFLFTSIGLSPVASDRLCSEHHTVPLQSHIPYLISSVVQLLRLRP